MGIGTGGRSEGDSKHQRELPSVIEIHLSAIVAIDECFAVRNAGLWLQITVRPARLDYLVLLASLPQHSGRAGKEERSQPPPSAWISVTASTMRRPRTFTAAISAARAAF